MNIGKLLKQGSHVTYDACYMIDNSCKSLDGRIYKPINEPDELNINVLHDMDIDYAILIWSDFADSRNMDNVRLKDRNL